jgi:hypothetical protein
MQVKKKGKRKTTFLIKNLSCFLQRAFSDQRNAFSISALMQMQKSKKLIESYFNKKIIYNKNNQVPIGRH